MLRALLSSQNKKRKRYYNINSYSELTEIVKQDHSKPIDMTCNNIMGNNGDHVLL